jgi:hypothetical protein
LLRSPRSFSGFGRGYQIAWHGARRRFGGVGALRRAERAQLTDKLCKAKSLVRLKPADKFLGRVGRP